MSYIFRGQVPYRFESKTGRNYKLKQKSDSPPLSMLIKMCRNKFGQSKGGWNKVIREAFISRQQHSFVFQSRPVFSFLRQTAQCVSCFPLQGCFAAISSKQLDVVYDISVVCPCVHKQEMCWLLCHKSSHLVLSICMYPSNNKCLFYNVSYAVCQQVISLPLDILFETLKKI